jgi:hypothetical protein
MFLSEREAARLDQIATNILFRRDVRAEFSD